MYLNPLCSSWAAPWRSATIPLCAMLHLSLWAGSHILRSTLLHAGGQLCKRAAGPLPRCVAC